MRGRKEHDKCERRRCGAKAHETTETVIIIIFTTTEKLIKSPYFRSRGGELCGRYDDCTRVVRVRCVISNIFYAAASARNRFTTAIIDEGSSKLYLVRKKKIHPVYVIGFGS